MSSRLVALRRRLPLGLRTAGLRRIGRLPERVFDLALPGSPPRTLDIRTPMRTVVSRDLAATGLAGYEPETLACFLAAIEVQDSRAVFDVGANIGVFSWLAASLTKAPVVAFEPTPDLVDQMRVICEANGLSVTIEPIALGAEPGRARLYLSENSDSSNSLRAGFRRSRRSVMVSVETIDGYVARTGVVPAVVKVDTESTEPDVLRGAGAVIAEHRPIVLCEVLAGRTEQELTAILQPFDYTWYRIDGPGPLEPRSAIEGDPTYEYKNWLFAPSPASPAFWERMAAWHASIAGLAPPSPAPAPAPAAAPAPAPAPAPKIKPRP